MRREVLRCLWSWPPFEICGRGHDGHTHIGTDPHRDHVLGHLLAEADSRVVALRHDVGEAVVDDDLDLDIGIVRKHPFQGRPQHTVSRMLARGNADRSARLVAQGGEAGELGIDRVEVRAGGTQQSFAGLGRRDTARGAREQAQAEPFLQSTHGVAQRRLRHAKLGRGAREALFPRDGQERDDVADVFPPHS